MEPAGIEVVSTTNDAFAAAAKQAVERLRFRPARIGGRAVRVVTRMPITWTLDDR